MGLCRFFLSVKFPHSQEDKNPKKKSFKERDLTLLYLLIDILRQQMMTAPIKTKIKTRAPIPVAEACGKSEKKIKDKSFTGLQG